MQTNYRENNLESIRENSTADFEVNIVSAFVLKNTTYFLISLFQSYLTD